MTKVYAIDGVVPVVDPTAYVHPSAVLIGDVIVGPECYIGPSASLRGDFGQIVIGGASNVQDNCTMHGFAGVTTRIGESCNIGHGSVVHGATLHDRVLVGMNAVVMDGAEIGENTLIAALAFVPAAMSVPANKIVAGTPAKVLRDLSDQEKTWKADGNRDYVNLVTRSRQTMKLTDALTVDPGEGPRLEIDGSQPLFMTRKGE